MNPYRSFRVPPQVVTHGALSALHPDYGPLWRFGGMPFEYGILLVAALLLVRNMMHAHSIHVRQSLALVVASILPLAGGTAYILRVSPWPDYNWATAVLSVSGLLMAYALFSCRLFDLAPLARDAVIEHLADGVMVLDVQGRLRDFNPAAALSFPELGKDSIGKPIAELFAARPDVGAVLQEAARGLADVGQTGPSVGTQLGRRERRFGRPCHGRRRGRRTGLGGQADGALDDAEPPLRRPHVLNLRATTVASGTGTVLGLAVVVCDVTERVALLDDALRLATTDGLTGVLTRRRFTELAELEIARAAARGTPLTVLLLDLDHLKVVNDTHGHVAGDRLLECGGRGLAGHVARRRPYGSPGRRRVLRAAAGDRLRRGAAHRRAPAQHHPTVLALGHGSALALHREHRHGDGRTQPAGRQVRRAPRRGRPGALRRQRGRSRPGGRGRHARRAGALRRGGHHLICRNPAASQAASILRMSS